MHSSPHPYQLEAAVAEILSNHQVPRRWYQGDGRVVVFAILTTFLGYVSVVAFGLRPPAILWLVSTFILLLGVAADSLTTYRVFTLKSKFDKRGLQFPIKEANPLMPNIPKPKDVFLGKPALLVGIAMLVTFFIPLAGWGIAMSLLAVSLNNHRHRQQAQYELQLYDTMTGKDWKKKEILTKEYLCAIPTAVG